MSSKFFGNKNDKQLGDKSKSKSTKQRGAIKSGAGVKKAGRGK